MTRFGFLTPSPLPGLRTPAPFPQPTPNPWPSIRTPPPFPSRPPFGITTPAPIRPRINPFEPPNPFDGGFRGGLHS